jgi:hypothetical protein
VLRGVRVMKLAALLCVLAVGCNERDHVTSNPAAAPTNDIPQRPDQMVGAGVVPMAHAFPPGRMDAIRRLFDQNVGSYPISVVTAQGAQTQFVNPKPVFTSDRQFVIGMPPAQHAAIDRMIAQLDKVPLTAPATYEVTFWLVEASPAAKVEVTAELAEVAPMLEKLANLGTRKFRSLDRVSARSVDAMETKLSGQTINVEHQLAAVPKGIEIALNMVLRTEGGPHIETKLTMPLDQPVVIGDSTQTSANGAGNLLLYVVRARRVD